tara:strand:+ start:285 stop:632 length:348 start_codon:yes stop_codon:yes gene_type:complete
LLKTEFSLPQIISEDTVAAAGKLTVVPAAIVFHGVAVITLFMTFGLGVVQATGRTISAAGKEAAIGAGIRGELVAIVAFFVGLNLSVAALTRDVANDHLFTGAPGQEKQTQETFD